jgi:hypothetical protein
MAELHAVNQGRMNFHQNIFRLVFSRAFTGGSNEPKTCNQSTQKLTNPESGA